MTPAETEEFHKVVQDHPNVSVIHASKGGASNM